jgi:hypothetical protein
VLLELAQLVRQHALADGAHRALQFTGQSNCCFVLMVMSRYVEVTK